MSSQPDRALRSRTRIPSNKLSTIGFVAATTAVAVSKNNNPNLGAFALPVSKPTTTRPTKNRWNLVSPPRSKRKSEDSEKKTPRRSKTKKVVEETTSFGALTAANFTSLKDNDIKIHTLILGTHPSVTSLEKSQYYGHNMNAFWYITGDCLGFRRNSGVSPSSGKPYKFSSFLRYDNIIPYEQQIELLCSKGFAIWDVVKACERPGSLDQDITKDEPNDIPGFIEKHPTVRRIVLANGASGCGFFKKHFSWWLDSGEVVPGKTEGSQTAFKKWKESGPSDHAIECISALAVSPAAATYTYEQKRDFWEEFVYKPGLKDHKELQRPHRRY